MIKDDNQFTTEELELINAFDADVPFRVLQTTNSEDLKILKTQSTEINSINLDLAHLIQRMHETVTNENSKGVGIAAPQVGINRQVILVQRVDKEDRPFEFYINPKIIWQSEILREGDEGCLSIPDVYKSVKRSLVITIEFQNLENEIFSETLEGFVAVIFQHEIDHLNGILFTDLIESQFQSQFIEASTKVNLYYEN
ncbi:peptide deformylase [Paenimyroides tangerinum]|uniref:Peptide deformylase n=1 Tax=Paenimyroides tangerinum TaxID=2488728 RepID=A0A3P3WE04_9FLAO|nr:peptide deformylase [Paenimyroides tangerinum]RRJ92638.1 peptide deformylase [Paenimyroides tangerinum]